MNAAVLFLWVFFASWPDVLPARCTSVLDGDTIEVVRGTEAIRIRLEGIDCPEGGQEYSDQAKKFTAELVLGKAATILPKENDDYGRLVARVFIDGRDISVELLRAGLAWHFKKYSSDWLLSRLEDQARSQKLGLWAADNPVPPWDYRSGRRKAPAVKATESRLQPNSRSTTATSIAGARARPSTVKTARGFFGRAQKR